MAETAVTVDDVETGDGREHYLVRPTEQVDGAAVLYLHWFDESPNANRSQFLDEAKRLGEAGVVSLLPQMSFPWHSPPHDVESDMARIRAEVEYLKRGYDSLAGVEGVDSSRIGIVGHDFGAMYGMLLLGEAAPRCGVWVAPTPRWADWFLRFWPIVSDRFDYMRALSAVDPITAIGGAGCPLLFQFARFDFYIAAMTGAELFEAAPEPKHILSYDSGHEMGDEEVRSDRMGFLAEHLGLSRLDHNEV